METYSLKRWSLKASQEGLQIHLVSPENEWNVMNDNPSGKLRRVAARAPSYLGPHLHKRVGQRVRVNGFKELWFEGWSYLNSHSLI